MLFNTPAQAEVTNFGTLKRIVAPEGWELEDSAEPGLSARRLKLFHVPGAREINISVFQRGAPISENSANYLLVLLKSKPAMQAPQPLNLEEVLALTEVLGYSTVGDNQFTNDAKRGTRDYPVFAMELAETAMINGKTVLRVSGNFQDLQAISTMEYKGLYFTDGQSGRIVEEVFYQAPSRVPFLKHLPQFEECLKTIEWA